jgi:hypothetical protein
VHDQFASQRRRKPADRRPEFRLRGVGGAGVIRRAIWPVAALLLMAAAFGVGRLGAGARSLPAIVATLPGDEAQFSRAFDERMRDRFPVGSSEDALVDYLAGERFAPEWRRRDGANAAAFVWSGLLCAKIVRVSWRADAAGRLTEVSGAYESHCE